MLSQHFIIFREHVRSIHTKEQNYQCSKCPRTFSSAWQAKSHMKNNHGVKKLYQCEKCLKKYKTPQALGGHTKFFHSTTPISQPKKVVKKLQEKICEICGKALLKNHECQENLEIVNCSICHKKMSSQALKAHLQYHRKKQVSNYLCQFCNKNLTTETSLKRHLLIHKNLKPFYCSCCEKSFRQKSALKAHERVHNGFRYDCKKCERKFITKSLLNQHINQSHKNE